MAFLFLPTVNSVDLLWNTDPLTNVQYQINSEAALKWHQARKSCQQQKAELLSITELHEQTYLTGRIILSILFGFVLVFFVLFFFFFFSPKSALL